MTTTPIEGSSTGAFAPSIAAWVIDAFVKIYTKIVSPSKGYLKAAVFGEASMDFNGKGGEVVGGYFVAEGTGKVNGMTVDGAVNDTVGVSARGDNRAVNGWVCGSHSEVHDYVGGTAIGANVEVQDAVAGHTPIAFNGNNWTQVGMDLIKAEGKLSTALNLEMANGLPTLLQMGGAHQMWRSGPVGPTIGGIVILIDGNKYLLPVAALK